MKYIFWLFVLTVLLLFAKAQVIDYPSGGGTTSGSITGAYSFNGPFSTVNATNVYLNATLSNQVMTGITILATNNLAITNLPVGTDLAVALSNAPATGAIYQLGAGTYTVTPRIVGLGVAGGNGQGAINIFSKTNLTIVGVPGKTIINGQGTPETTNGLGEVLFITNCLDFVIKDVIIKGKAITNIVITGTNDLPLYALVGVFNSRNGLFENVSVQDSFDHGLWDAAANSGVGPHSTNITVRGGLFSNIGSQRTNALLVADGAAIIPTGWLIENVELRDNLRHIEPYDETDGYPFTQCIIRNCRMYGSIDSALYVAGSTNGHGIIIEGNYIEQPRSYARRGTNAYSPASGIHINGGQRPIIRNNTVRGYSAGVNLVANVNVFGAEIIGNTLEFQTNHWTLASGYGIYVGDGVAAAVRIFNAYIANNLIRESAGKAMYFFGLGDSTVQNNYLIEPVSAGGADAVHFQDAGGATANSNILVVGNTIIDRGTVDADSGFYIDNTLAKSIRFVDNIIQGPATLYNNSAGTNVSIVMPGTDVRVTHNNGDMRVATAYITNGNSPTLTATSLLGVNGAQNWTNITTGANLSLAADMTLSATGLSNSMVVINGSQSMTNAARVIYIETNQPLKQIIEAATAGTLIVLGVGTNRTVGSNVVDVPHGVSVRGMGRDVSFVEIGWGDASEVKPGWVSGSSATYENFSIVLTNRNVFQGVGNSSTFGQKAATNTVWQNVDVYGETDCWFWNHTSPCSAKLFNCRGISKYDVVAYGGSGGSTNHHFRFYTCDFLIDQANPTHASITTTSEPRMVYAGSGKSEFFACALIVTNTTRTCTMFTPIAGGDLGDIFFSGCSWRFPAGAQAYRNLVATTGKNFLIDGGFVNGAALGPAASHILPTLVNHRYTNSPGDGIIRMPNSASSVTGRTNVMMDASWNGGSAFGGHTVTIYDEGGTASGTNIWLQSQFGQTFNGGASATNLITVNYGSVTVVIRNTNWFVLSRSP